MQITNSLMTLALLAMGVNAVPAPLNINLGAYSPALVVGDGALTFGGGEAAGAGEGAGKGNGKANGGGAAAAGAAAVAARSSESGSGSAKMMQKRQLAGFDRALKFAEAALTKGPKIQLGNGEGGAGVGIIVDNNPAAAAAPVGKAKK